MWICCGVCLRLKYLRNCIYKKYERLLKKTMRFGFYFSSDSQSEIYLFIVK